MGSPKGAFFQTVISSSGKHPISINFKVISSFSKDLIFTFVPGFICDKFINLIFGKYIIHLKKSISILEINLGTLHFINNGISPEIKDKIKLKNFLAFIFENEKIAFKKLNYIFCNDDYLLKLNTEFLGHNTLTDILTFSFSNKGLPIIAEIYISVQRVKENSLKLNVGYYPELYRVMFHGILHLCGYSDHNLKEKKLMRKMENFYLNKYCFT